MKPVRLHPRVYDDIGEALAYTREQFGPRQVVLYARLISKGRRTCDGTRPSANYVKISALEYECIASRRDESTRRMVCSSCCTIGDAPKREPTNEKRGVSFR